MTKFDDALLLAVKAHDGQVRTLPNGTTEPYVCHPIRVASQFYVDTARTIAVLHDVLEDTELTHAELTQFGSRVADAVVHLTRLETETYAEFIDRIATINYPRVLIRVKLADLEDNLATLDTEHERLRPRYEKARAKLLQVDAGYDRVIDV